MGAKEVSTLGSPEPILILIKFTSGDVLNKSGIEIAG